MKKEKIRNLEKKCWKVGSALDFLNLSREEEKYIHSRKSFVEFMRQSPLYGLELDLKREQTLTGK